jgi:amino acid transporter
MGRRPLTVVERQGLKADSLRLWHLVAVGLAFQSLALVVYLNVGFIEQTAGPVAPVVFLLVTLASIPTAISFAVMSNRRPSAEPRSPGCGRRPPRRSGSGSAGC